MTVPPTQPPDPSLLIETIFKVPADTDIQSEEFITDLEKRLADAYRFAELSRRRRKRETPEINATVSTTVFIINILVPKTPLVFMVFCPVKAPQEFVFCSCIKIKSIATAQQLFCKVEVIQFKIILF